MIYSISIDVLSTELTRIKSRIEDDEADIADSKDKIADRTRSIATKKEKLAEIEKAIVALQNAEEPKE